MGLVDVIRKRHSCRSYSNKPVDKKTVVKLLELANWAPSAGNNQNRQFVVITGREDRKWLAEMNNQSYLAEAPVVILVTTRMNPYFESKEKYLKDLEKWEMRASSEVDDLEGMARKWGIEDAAAAVENLLLAATEMGLGSCWLGIMDFEGVKKRFGLPDEVEPVCLITLGYEKQSPGYRTERKKIEELVHWERW